MAVTVLRSFPQVEHSCSGFNEDFHICATDANLFGDSLKCAILQKSSEDTNIF